MNSSCLKVNPLVTAFPSQNRAGHSVIHKMNSTDLGHDPASTFMLRALPPEAEACLDLRDQAFSQGANFKFRAMSA